MEQYLAPLAQLGISYEKPKGGFFYWISLPEEINPRKLMQICRKQGVSFPCGDMFLLREAEQRYIRLCFTHEQSDRIKRGMSIICEVLRTRKEIYQ
jgi:DNA-binding transcriptional MocR family regulator